MDQRVTYGIIWAEDEAGGIGRAGQIPWRGTPEGKRDMRDFRELTDGCTVVCGRVTAESFGWVLPGRRVIVVTSRAPPEGILPAPLCVRSLEEALSAAISRVWIAGGRRLYEQAFALGAWDRLVITRIPGRYDCDVFAPRITGLEARKG